MAKTRVNADIGEQVLFTQPFEGLTKQEFDKRVKALREDGVIAKNHDKKKADATIREWAEQKEYDANKRERKRKGLTQPRKRRIYPKGHVWKHPDSEHTNTAVTASKWVPVGNRGREGHSVVVQCSCGSKPRMVWVNDLGRSNPDDRLKGCRKCANEERVEGNREAFELVSVGDTIGKRTVTEASELITRTNYDGSHSNDQRLKVRCECGEEAEIWLSTAKKCPQCRLCVADERKESIPIGTSFGDEISELTTVSEVYFSSTHYKTSCHARRTLVVDVQCSCEAKTITTVNVSGLKGGNVKSCGCRQAAVTSKRNIEEDQASRALTCRWEYRNVETGETILMRSSWELAAAYYFDEQGIRWEYEKEWFKFTKKCRYQPDFYLPDTDEWVEVKGDHLLEKFEEKAKLFRELGHVLHIWSKGTFVEKLGMTHKQILEKYAAHQVLFKRNK